MAKGQVRSNREAKKPKKEKPKVAASTPSLTKIATPPKKKQREKQRGGDVKPEAIRLGKLAGGGRRAQSIFGFSRNALKPTRRLSEGAGKSQTDSTQRENGLGAPCRPSRDIATDAGFFAADRFSKACCGKAVELANAATAWMNAREVAQRRAELSKLTWPEEL